VHGERAAHHLVGLDVHAEVDQARDLAIDDVAWQAERRNAVAQHAAGHVQRLDDRHVDASPRKVCRARQTGGAGTDHRRARAVRRSDRGGGHGAVVADEAFEPADGNRLHLAGDHTLALALGLLRADAAAHRRQDVRLANHTQRAIDVLHQQVADEPRDVDGDRATADAGRAAALQATFGLA